MGIKKYKSTYKIKLKYILPLILLMSIGYASISIIANINGRIRITNNFNDFNVYINNAIDENNTIILNNDRQGFQANIEVDSEVTYEIVNESTEYDVIVSIICSHETTTIESDELTIEAMSKDNGTISLTSTKNYTCTLNIESLERSSKKSVNNSLLCNIGEEWLFNYVEDSTGHGYTQEFITPCDGVYKLEVWGASGGGYNNSGGYGGYSTANINLSKNTQLYITTGGAGIYLNPDGESRVIKGGYNGGGNGFGGADDSLDRYFSSGGGATHIATSLKGEGDSTGELKNYVNDKSDVLIVAGAGGGGFCQGDLCDKGGSGGGYKGVSSTDNFIYDIGWGNWGDGGTGGTQTQGGYGNCDDDCSLSTDQYGIGSFGLGGTHMYPVNSGGGSGWYGGGSSTHVQAGGGGSGYIGYANLFNKSMFCYDCDEATNSNTDEDIFTISTTGTSKYVDALNCPSGYSSTPSSHCAKEGNGYAKITLIDSNLDDTKKMLYYAGNEVNSITGGWKIGETSPHYTNFDSSNINKTFDYIYNKVEDVWTSSNLSTTNAIDFTNYSSLCYDLTYYIPNQNSTGQGIYYGFTINNYNEAYRADYLPVTNEPTRTTVCTNLNDIGFAGYPLLEIYNGHTAIPYSGWVANTYFYLHNVYLVK